MLNNFVSSYTIYSLRGVCTPTPADYAPHFFLGKINNCYLLSSRHMLNKFLNTLCWDSFWSRMNRFQENWVTFYFLVFKISQKLFILGYMSFYPKCLFFHLLQHGEFNFYLWIRVLKIIFSKNLFLKIWKFLDAHLVEQILSRIFCLVLFEIRCVVLEL